MSRESSAQIHAFVANAGRIVSVREIMKATRINRIQVLETLRGLRTRGRVFTVGPVCAPCYTTDPAQADRARMDERLEKMRYLDTLREDMGIK